MRPEEANRIYQIIAELGLPEGATILNIGSSTAHFREETQPHIQNSLITPLMNLGFKFVHCDQKVDDGIDIVGDVFEQSTQEELRSHGAAVVLCCNLLEHLIDAKRFATACGALVRAGGYIVVSVPLSYPIHHDPIDTGLRPTPRELAAFFPDLDQILGEVIVSGSYLHDMLNKDGGRLALVLNVLKTLVPLYRPSRWWARVERLAWIFKRYRVSLAVFAKPSKVL